MGRTLVLAAVLAAFAVPALAQKSVTMKQHEAREHYKKGRDAMYSERWDEAEQEFRWAIKLDPLLYLAHHDLGQTYMATRRYPEAVRAFTGAIDSFNQVAGLAGADDAALERRRLDEIQDLRDSVKLFESGRIKTGSPGGVDLAQITRLEERIRQLEKERLKTTGPPEVPAEFTLALGSAHLRAGNLAEAEQQYRLSLRRRPGFGEAHNNLAALYMQTGRFREAAEQMRSAERAGYVVHPQFKADLEKQLAGGTD